MTDRASEHGSDDRTVARERFPFGKPNFVTPAVHVDTWDLLGTPRLDAVSELFHENTKIRPGATGFVISAEALQVMSEGFKSYEVAETIELPRPCTDLGMSLVSAIQSRRSLRDFTGESMSITQLSTLLFLANGQGLSSFRRTVPSAGALYPLEVYPIVLRGNESVPVGVYHYNVRRALLERVSSASSIDLLGQAIFVPEVTETASVVLIVTAVFGRTKIKYGERGYRFALLEAGHVAQNICLTAVAMGHGACPIGGFVDDYLSELVDVDGVDEAPVYMVAVGSISQPR